MFPLIRLLLGLGCALGLAGCGAIEFAYSKAPTYIADEIDEALDLNAGQRAQIDRQMRALFAWHREHELIQYRRLLDRAAGEAVDGIAATEIVWLVEAVRAARFRLMRRAIDQSDDFAHNLSPQQIEHFRQYHREASAEYDAYLEKSDQQRVIYRSRRDLQRLEKWFGDFDDLLEARVLARLEQVPDLWEPWLQYREARHQALIRALTAGNDADTTRAAVVFALLDPASEHERDFEPLRRAYWQAYATAIEDIDGWLSTRQRQHAISRLQSYAETLAGITEPD